MKENIKTENEPTKKPSGRKLITINQKLMVISKVLKGIKGPLKKKQV